jgi:hypothetical protein
MVVCRKLWHGKRRRLQLRHQQLRLCKFGIGYFGFADAGNTNTGGFNSVA